MEESNPISIEIEHSRGSELDLTITNIGSEDLYFSSYDVPMRGHIKQYFKITDENGSEVPYIGILALMEQTRDMWKLIKSGENIDLTVNLYGEYDFPSTSGKYNIEFISDVTVMDINAIEGRVSNEDGEFIPADDGQMHTVNSNNIESEIDITNAFNPELETRGKYYPCSASQKSWINETMGKAKTITSQAVQYAKRNKTDSVWKALFGKKSEYYNFTLNGLTKIKSSTQQNWTYSCKPDSGGAIASTSKSSTYRVTLWPPYFKDTTSKKLKFSASVLAHEASHWYAVIGTSDYAYYSNCKKLARRARKAIKNADSYRQYIMNASN